jgi:hypothetical protein
MIIMLLDLQLPVHLVPITTKGVNSNPAHDEVYSIQHFPPPIKKCLWTNRY